MGLTHLPIHPIIHPCIHLSIHSIIHPSIHLSIHPSIYAVYAANVPSIQSSTAYSRWIDVVYGYSLNCPQMRTGVDTLSGRPIIMPTIFRHYLPSWPPPSVSTAVKPPVTLHIRLCQNLFPLTQQSNNISYD